MQSGTILWILILFFFWQVEVHQSDREKTALSTNQGLYQFVVMPFGTVNSPSTFERLLEDVLRELQWQACLLWMTL